MSLALHALLVFGLVAVGDICWARYTAHAADRNRVRASLWATAIYLVGSMTVIQYTGDHRLIVPAIAGAFVGTWLGVRK